MKKTIFEVVGVILRFAFNISIIVLGVYLVYFFSSQAYAKAKDISTAAFTEEKVVRSVSVAIPSGATTLDVAEILHKAGLVSSVDWFRIQSRLEHMDGKYKSGDYTLNTSMSDAEMMEFIAKGTAGIEEITITIPEGYTAAQIGQYLEEKGICSADDFRFVMNNTDFGYSFLEEVPERETLLEGYLFPDTYFITAEATPEEIISKMLSRFEEVYNEEVNSRNIYMPLDEAITKASIIEAEIRVPEERALCSSVIENRLEIGMPLQMDATVQYALGNRKSQLLLADLEVDSPYNTYRYPGLPGGPICNPGRASIRAALNPADTEYLYYVVNNLEIGSHEFTSDYDSFLEAKEKYRNMQ